jgi:anthranilate phosphoribosyltransferase
VKIAEALDIRLAGRTLSRAEARRAMAALIDEATPEQVGALLMALRFRTETLDELLGFVDCLSERAIKVERPRDAVVMDVCGTGGDCAGTFNVSTTVAFVLASCGVQVAKHGNRSVSSRSGSFDVLEALGFAIEADPAKAAERLRAHGLAFLFAPAFHPALKPLAPIRRSLGVRTVFNAMGPLLNPVALDRQLVGVYEADLVARTAEVLRGRGLQQALVVRGEDGLDELSLAGPTRAARLRDGSIREFTLQPEDFGLRRASREAVAGGGPEENARILTAILRGEERGPRRDLVLMNAGAALVLAGEADGWAEGARVAAQAVDTGRAWALFESVRAA